MRVLFMIAHPTAFVLGRKGFGPGKQKWGYVTVRPGAHMFWWLYYTSANVTKFTDRPLIIWLQGGPGASSTGYGNFAELGILTSDLKPRNHTWVKNANVLFVDNPVGTGWSYVDEHSALTTNNRQIANDFEEFLKGFYEKLPNFKKVPMYIFSESYGGKMAVEISLVLDTAIKAKRIQSNFIGVGLGNPWISPIDSVLTWAPFLYYFGVVDIQGYDKIMVAAQRTKTALDKGQFVQATTEWDKTEEIISSVAIGVNFYNVLTKISARKQTYKIGDPIEKNSFQEDQRKITALMKGPVKKALKLKVNWGAQAEAVSNALKGDFMKPVTKIVETLLDKTNLKIAVFTGQLDIIVDTPGTVIWVDKLKWSKSTQWPTTPRRAVTVNNINEGYVKTLGNLRLFWVNRAGHMVPADNPPAMDAILRMMTNNYSPREKREDLS